jgi:hypothetical protein
VKNYETLVNGQPPPFVIPFCASCDMPVEAFTVFTDPQVDSTGQALFVADAECHGKTSGVRMPIAEWEARQKTGAKLVLFQRREGFDSVR